MSASAVECALVLTAGLGTRLRPLTYDRAKAAMPVAGQPLIHRLLKRLAQQEVRDVVLNLHHKPDTITRLVGDGAEVGVRVRYSWEQPLLGSAGGPRRALPLLGANRFFIINGDTLTDLDLHVMAAAHERSGARVTMALIPNPDPSHYGGVIVDERGWVQAFTAAGSQQPSFHFIGGQVVEAEVFARLPDGQRLETVMGLYPEMIARDARSIAAFVSDASFHDIGTAADYLETSLAFARVEDLESLPLGRGSHIHPTARLTRTAVWDQVVVEESSDLVDCVIGDRVQIPAGSRFSGCAIVSGRGRTPRGGETIVGDLLVASITRRADVGRRS